MRSALALTLVALSSPAFAQPRAEGAAPSGTGYSYVASTPRAAVPSPAPAAAPTSQAAPLAPTATVTLISSRPAAPAPAPSAVATGGPRGPAADPTGARPGEGVVRLTEGGGSTTFTLDRRGQITAPAPAQPASSDPDAGVGDPSMPTAGALFGGPLPGPAIAYMGQPVNARNPPPAPPLAPGAAAPAHALPGSTPAPPGGAAPWIPFTTSGFQLGTRGEPTGIGGYGFQMPTGSGANPGTIRNSP
ncbi:MAG: hypothetical protein R3A48_16975 [Polyangiales bacterium]